jgi:hypothetical protein
MSGPRAPRPGAPEPPPTPEEIQAAAHTLARARRVVGEGTCPECGTPFAMTTAGGPTRKKHYCSQRCAHRSWQRANAERLRAYQREHYHRQRQRDQEAPQAEPR